MPGIVDIISAEGINEIVIHQMKDAGLVARHISCPCRNIKMKMMADKKKDGWRWRCTICKSSKSVRHNSFFKDSNLPIVTWMKLIRDWAENNATVSELKLDLTLSKRTVMGALKNLRDMCHRVVDDNGLSVGGQGTPVVILEVYRCMGNCPV